MRWDGTEAETPKLVGISSMTQLTALEHTPLQVNAVRLRPPVPLQAKIVILDDVLRLANGGTSAGKSSLARAQHRSMTCRLRHARGGQSI